MTKLSGKCQNWLSTSRGQILWLNLLLVSTILFTYWQVGSHEFVNLDTPSYITQNRHVNSGLTRDNIVWAFTSSHESNWHPLTWLSHMLDVQLFGLAPGPHHLVNLFLHILNSLLLFYLFRRLTRTIWPPALVAAIFALHPLHVESVAWVAERKDVLSGCFWMFTLISYSRYVEQPRLKRYLPVLCFLGLGLMAKSMLVTLPAVMLLLDYWPLARFKPGQIGQDNFSAPSPARLIREKLPLFVLSVMAGAIALYTQHKSGAMSSIDDIPIMARLANSLVSYVAYLGKTIWPANLAVFYPLGNLSAWQVAGAALLLLAICFLIFRCWKSRPWLLVGWLWYLGTLVPVIGLVQVGQQAMADRYTYLPQIGLSIMIAWSLTELVTIRPRLKPVIIAMIFIVVTILTLITKVQVSHWRDSISLNGHALASTTDNPLAHYNLAIFLSDHERLDEAAPHFAEALRLNPNSVLYLYGFGLNLDRQGKIAEAERYYQKTLILDTNHRYSHELYVYLGVIQAKKGLFKEAVDNFRKSLSFAPDNVPALFLLGNAMLAQGKPEEAFASLSAAVRLDPKHVYAFCSLADVKVSQGKPEEALGYLSEALRVSPEETYIRERIEFVKQSMIAR